MAQLTVLTRNLYLGADTLPAVEAMGTPGFLAAALAIQQQMLDSRPEERLQTIAAEVAACRADVVGVQELCRWSTTAPGEEPVVVDHGVALTAALAEAGQGHRVVAAGGDFTIRVTGHDGARMSLSGGNAILVGPRVAVVDYGSGHFDAVARFGATAVPHGWVLARLTVDGLPITVLNAHLEAYVEPVRVAQAEELAAMVAGVRGPLVVLGDLNSDPGTDRRAAHDVLVPAGLTDAWTAVHPDDPGATGCHDADLRNPEPTLTERIDHVLVQGVTVRDAWLTGHTAAGRTPGGLWPSDHAGVAVRLSLE